MLKFVCFQISIFITFSSKQTFKKKVYIKYNLQFVLMDTWSALLTSQSRSHKLARSESLNADSLHQFGIFLFFIWSPSMLINLNRRLNTSTHRWRLNWKRECVWQNVKPQQRVFVSSCKSVSCLQCRLYTHHNRNSLVHAHSNCIICFDCLFVLRVLEPHKQFNLVLFNAVAYFIFNLYSIHLELFIL